MRVHVVCGVVLEKLKLPFSVIRQDPSNTYMLITFEASVRNSPLDSCHEKQQDAAQGILDLALVLSSICQSKHQPMKLRLKVIM